MGKRKRKQVQQELNSDYNPFGPVDLQSNVKMDETESRSMPERSLPKQSTHYNANTEVQHVKEDDSPNDDEKKPSKKNKPNSEPVKIEDSMQEVSVAPTERKKSRKKRKRSKDKQPTVDNAPSNTLMDASVCVANPAPTVAKDENVSSNVSKKSKRRKKDKHSQKQVQRKETAKTHTKKRIPDSDSSLEGIHSHIQKHAEILSHPVALLYVQKLEQKLHQTEKELAGALDELEQARSLIDKFIVKQSELENTIQCSICLDTLVHPQTVECGHTFCFMCLFGWLRSQSPADRKCPACRTMLRQHPMLSRSLQDQIDAMVKNLAQDKQDDYAARVADVKRTLQAYPLPWSGLINTITVLHDVEDGVDRCPRCGWEVLFGRCANCALVAWREGQDELNLPAPDSEEEEEDEGYEYADYLSDDGFVVDDDVLDEVTDASQSDSDTNSASQSGSGADIASDEHTHSDSDDSVIQPTSSQGRRLLSGTMQSQRRSLLQTLTQQRSLRRRVDDSTDEEVDVEESEQILPSPARSSSSRRITMTDSEEEDE